MLRNDLTIALRTLRRNLGYSVDDAQHAARIAWGNNLAMADVLILQGFLDAEVDRIVTTGRDLEQYEGGPDMEVL